MVKHAEQADKTAGFTRRGIRFFYLEIDGIFMKNDKKQFNSRKTKKAGTRWMNLY